MLGNPELTRNLWIELTPLRLIAAIAAPLMILTLSVDDRGWERDFITAGHMIILAVVAFWGARKAADAVATEIRERTWDQQRLGGLSPAQMTLGKVFGAPSSAWVVVLVCCAAQLAVIQTLAPGTTDSFAIGRTVLDAKLIAAELAGAFAVFAIAFFASLLAQNGQERARAFDATLFQVVAVASGMMLVLMIEGAATAERLSLSRAEAANQAWPMRWWDQSIPTTSFLTLSFLFFGGWALYGGVHQMRRAFAMPTSSVAWGAFLIMLAVFAAGFQPDYALALAATALLGAAYGAVLLEPHRLAGYRGWLRRFGTAPLVAAITAPAWIYAWIGGAALAIAAIGTAEWKVPEVLEDMLRFDGTTATLALALFVLRDMGVCVWAGLRAADGRGLWAAVFILALLYALIIPFLSLLGAAPRALFLPLNEISLVSGAVQSLLIWALAAREIAQPVAAPKPAAS